MARWLGIFERWSASWWGRVVIALIVFWLTMISYVALNRGLQPRVTFLTPLDEAIPFLPWTIVIYYSMYAMMLVAAARVSARDYVRLMGALLLANGICYVGFITLPAHYPRPDPALMEAPLWRAVFTYTFESDGPGNTFPSLHVTITALLAWGLRQRSRLWLVWGALVCVSTMTVKQHFVADVIGGLAVAALTWWLCFGRGDQDAAASSQG